MTKTNLRRILYLAVTCAVLAGIIGCATQENLVADFDYALLPEPDPQYPDTDGKALTDGLHASVDNIGKGWVGFSEGEPTITLDLKTVCKVDSVEASFLSYAEFGIDVPESVKLLVSQDGDRWISSGSLGPSEANPAVFRIETPGLRVRYVRLVMERKNWVLIDEVKVLGTVSKSVLVPVLTGNLAQGLVYRIDTPPSRDYPDVTGTTLTDGKFASEDDLQSGWIAFDENSPALTFDLQTVCKIDRLTASFLANEEFSIQLPISVELLVSQDGRRWIANGTLTPSAVDPSVFVIETPDLRVRFLRLVIEREENWVFIDEVQIFGSIAPALNPVVPIVSGNVATHVAYLLDPPPNSHYPDAQGVTLTDGKHASPDSLQDGWVGFDKGQPSVTMDLESICRINSIEASFLAQEDAGADLPKAVRLMFSLDGERWFLGGPLTASAEGTSKLRLEMDELRARYLRLEIVRQQWTLIDEIKVFGSLTPTFFSLLSIDRWDVWLASPGPDYFLNGQIQQLSEGY